MIQLLLTVLLTMVTAFFGVVGWWLSRLSGRVENLTTHREGCIRQFADNFENQASHRRIFDLLDNHSRTIHEHGIELNNMKKEHS